MTARVSTAYTATYPDPIRFKAGTRLAVGSPDPENPAWIWCGAEGREGWVHESVIDGGSAREDYDAREVTVDAGAKVEVVRRLGGWAWVTVADGRSGWLPESCLE